MQKNKNTILDWFDNKKPKHVSYAQFTLCKHVVISVGVPFSPSCVFLHPNPEKRHGTNFLWPFSPFFLPPTTTRGRINSHVTVVSIVKKHIPLVFSQIFQKNYGCEHNIYLFFWIKNIYTMPESLYYKFN